MSSIIRDERGRFVPIIEPKLWDPLSVRLSRERTDRIGRARKQQKARLARTQWTSELDRRGICDLEAHGIEWGSVETWLDALDPREAYAARRYVKQILCVLGDDEALPREQMEAHNDLYRRLIAAGIVD